MSDQVIFTKEEVENIREFVSRFHTAGIKADAVDIRNAKYIKEILDSPRPRPQIDIRALREIACYSANENGLDDNEIKDIINKYHFDVED
jgi:hypothetical protein